MLEAKKLELIQEKVCCFPGLGQLYADCTRSTPRKPQLKSSNVKTKNKLVKEMLMPSASENGPSAAEDEEGVAGVVETLTPADHDSRDPHHLADAPLSEEHLHVAKLIRMFQVVVAEGEELAADGL